MDSQQHYTNLKTEITELRGEIKDIKDALIGEDYQGEDGLIRASKKMVIDIYGTPEERANCLITRMSKIEDAHKEHVNYVKGKILWVTGIWIGISITIGVIFKAFGR